MIETISPEKWAELHEYRNNVFRETTTPGLDYEKAVESVRAAYGAIGKAPPQVVSVPSPLAAQYLIQALTSLQVSKNRKVLNALVAVKQFDVDILDKIEEIAGKKVAKEAASTKTMVYPSIDADSWWRAWSAFYKFCETLPLKKPYDATSKQNLDIVDRVCSVCGWVWAYEGLAIVSERPESNWSDDDIPVLHHPTGPSVRFRDGFELYHWRGTQVPKEWVIDRKNISAKDALTHPNMEQRRCAAEMLDWNIFDGVDTTIIDEDPDPEIGTLFEVELEGFKEKFLKVLCGTGRMFTYPVPPECKTALEAQSKIWGVPEDVYLALEVRT